MFWEMRTSKNSRQKSEVIYRILTFTYMGRGNNADRPNDDRGEGITSTQKVGNFFCCNLIWEGPKLPKKMTPPLLQPIEASGGQP